MFIRLIKSCIPCIPLMLPVLLFCRKTDLEIQRKLLDIEKIEDHVIWKSISEEKMMVSNIVNDVKIIGKTYFLIFF